jgi:gamma-glutamylcyclotransferase (GGCT)/AIG2-like uncharacterized protein YtfP
LIHPDLLALRRNEVEPIFVDDHFRVLEPHPPGFLGNTVEYALPKRSFDGGFVQTLELSTQLDALNHTRHGDLSSTTRSNFSLPERGASRHNDAMEARMSRILLFVYGTLLSGEPSHALLGASESAGSARTARAFDLLDLGEYPAMARGGHTAIAGELYWIDRATRARLDEYEGHPHLYRRTRIALDDGRHAQSYVLCRRTTAEDRRIETGDWRLLSKTRSTARGS